MDLNCSFLSTSVCLSAVLERSNKNTSNCKTTLSLGAEHHREIKRDNFKYKFRLQYITISLSVCSNIHARTIRMLTPSVMLGAGGVVLIAVSVLIVLSSVGAGRFHHRCRGGGGGGMVLVSRTAGTV